MSTITTPQIIIKIFDKGDYDFSDKKSAKIIHGGNYSWDKLYDPVTNVLTIVFAVVRDDDFASSGISNHILESIGFAFTNDIEYFGNAEPVLRTNEDQSRGIFFFGPEIEREIYEKAGFTFPS